MTSSQPRLCHAPCHDGGWPACAVHHGRHDQGVGPTGQGRLDCAALVLGGWGACRPAVGSEDQPGGEPPPSTTHCTMPSLLDSVEMHSFLQPDSLALCKWGARTPWMSVLSAYCTSPPVQNCQAHLHDARLLVPSCLCSRLTCLSVCTM